MRTLVFDVETTGLDPYSDNIIQFSAYEVEKDNLFNIYVIPDVSISKEATEITGLDLDEILGQKSISQEELASYLFEIFNNVDIVIGMNTRFDWTFVIETMKRYYYNYTNNPLVWDIYLADKIRDKWRPGKRRLLDLARTYEIPIDESKLHDSSYDVELTYKVHRIQMERFRLSLEYIAQDEDLKNSWYNSFKDNIQELYFYLREKEKDGGDPVINYRMGYPIMGTINYPIRRNDE